MPKLTEITVTYSRTVQAAQYEPEHASVTLKAVYQDGEAAEPEDLINLSNDAQDEVERILGITDKSDGPAIDGGVVTRVPENPTSAPAAASGAEGGSRRTRSSASPAVGASGGEPIANPPSAATASPASGGRRRSGSSGAAQASSAEPASGQSEVNPTPATGRVRSRSNASSQTSTNSAPVPPETGTTSATAPSTISPSEYKFTDVTKACSMVAEATKKPLLVLELLEEFKAVDGVPCTLANQLQKDDWAEFIQLCNEEADKAKAA